MKHLNLPLLASVLLHLLLLAFVCWNYRDLVPPRQPITVVEYLDPARQFGYEPVATGPGAGATGKSLLAAALSPPAAAAVVNASPAAPQLPTRSGPRRIATPPRSMPAFETFKRAGSGGTAARAAAAEPARIPGYPAGVGDAKTAAGATPAPLAAPSHPGGGAAKGANNGSLAFAGGALRTAVGGAPKAGGAGASGGSHRAGRGDSSSPKALDAYLARVKALVEKHRKYPPAALRSGKEGSCLREFVLARNGSVQSITSVSSCGSLLDHAATRAIASVGNFPPLPDDIHAPISLTLPIRFELSKGE